MWFKDNFTRLILATGQVFSKEFYMIIFADSLCNNLSFTFTIVSSLSFIVQQSKTPFRYIVHEEDGSLNCIYSFN